MAKAADMWLSLGGFPEKTKVGDVDKVFNSHVILDNQGQTRAVYRKIHLFDVVGTRDVHLSANELYIR
jgi:predicted amidohydrolase